VRFCAGSLLACTPFTNQTQQNINQSLTHSLACSPTSSLQTCHKLFALIMLVENNATDMNKNVAGLSNDCDNDSDSGSGNAYTALSRQADGELPPRASSLPVDGVATATATTTTTGTDEEEEDRLLCHEEPPVAPAVEEVAAAPPPSEVPPPPLPPTATAAASSYPFAGPNPFVATAFAHAAACGALPPQALAAPLYLFAMSPQAAAMAASAAATMAAQNNQPQPPHDHQHNSTVAQQQSDVLTVSSRDTMPTVPAPPPPAAKRRRAEKARPLPLPPPAPPLPGSEPIGTPISGPAPSQSGDAGCGRTCLHCGTTKTPLWRNGPKGAKTLCNACGVRFKLGKLQPLPSGALSPSAAYQEAQRRRAEAAAAAAAGGASRRRRERERKRRREEEQMALDNAQRDAKLAELAPDWESLEEDATADDEPSVENEARDDGEECITKQRKAATLPPDDAVARLLCIIHQIE